MTTQESKIKSLSKDLKKVYEKYEQGGLSQRQFKETILTRLGQHETPCEVERKLNDVGASFTGLMQTITHSARPITSPTKGQDTTSGLPYSFKRYKRLGELKGGPHDIFPKSSPPEDIPLSSRPTHASKFSSPVAIDPRELVDIKKSQQFNPQSLLRSSEDELRHLSNVYLEKKKAPPSIIQANKSNGDIISWSSPPKENRELLVSARAERTRAVPDMYKPLTWKIYVR